MRLLRCGLTVNADRNVTNQNLVLPLTRQIGCIAISLADVLLCAQHCQVKIKLGSLELSGSLFEAEPA